ncbi:efflux RND transporter periplasmic adaptor subunit [Sinomicrobium weinanense]|uniref:Efflux RND transporter periplasmic adaptor subunit n=1 Tax=Sinomicrobium weinanense TaxID=2842200 RepID=A0A926JNM1_9FLAO|nr:efflux RND transporter periplasmic adaptor subunit [Sinomicrobium weinanense]MBC9794489.1 efflux RND transporter periplasmic adaptor subunit [Sinomicrobium weinanense]MBU3124396.1 efflux RND transporter periplasmic adaptor subunit [Sinomicrobium weinanense]
MRTKTILKYMVAMAVIAPLLTSCNQAQPQGQQAMAIPFPTVKVARKDIVAHKQFPASIEGVVSSEVRAKVSGYIQDVLVDEGENVRKGQPLFRLETQTLSQDAEAAKAQVNVAQVEVNKLVPLVEKGIIGDVQLETAKANLAQARSNYNSIAANIGYATIKSPVDGVVGSIPFRKGTLVSAADAVPLTTVSSIENVYAYFSMNEKDFISFTRNVEGKTLDDKARNMPKVKLLLADGSSYEEEGTIETITGQIDTQTGTVSFRATFPNPTLLLRNGSSGTIMVPERYDDALVVPALSSFEQQGKKFVYIVADNDSIYARSIQSSAEVDNLLVIKDGIKENEQILGKGVGKARPGMKITPQPTSIDSIVNSFNTVFK